MTALSRRAAIFSAAATLALAFAAPSQAQDSAAKFPNKPIRMIIPFGAGGGNDIFARLVGQKMSEVLGEKILVENRPGAGGRIAAAYMRTQPKDGYTIFVGASGVMAVSPAVYSNLKYDAVKDFIPLTQIAHFPLILVVNATHPAKTVKEMVEWAKKHPDKSNYATTSPAFTITCELLKLKSGMPGVAIPYKSSNEMILSVISGQTMMAIADGPPTIPQVKAGKVRALAVTGSERSDQLPDVPSMKEAGYPDVDVHLWSGIFVLAGTPPAIVAKLEAAARKAVQDAGVQQKLKAMAVDPGGMSGAEFHKVLVDDIAKFKGVAKAAHLTFE